MKTVINYKKDITFENGYTASIICGNGTNMDCSYTLGGQRGLFEIAVIHNDSIVYEPTITGDEQVLGYLDFAEVAEILNKIKNLPPK